MVKVTPPETTKSQRTTEGILVLPFTVLIDTREQLPWSFTGFTGANREWIVKTQSATLDTGDYTISGFEDRLAIERKSGDDFLGSIGGGHERFRREHERMYEIAIMGGFACVIIESSLDRLIAELADPTSGRRMVSETILGIVASWSQKYGVHFLFAGDRRTAESLALRVMMKFWEQRQPKQKDLFE